MSNEEFYVLRVNELIKFSQYDLPPKNFRKHQSKQSQIEEMIFFSFFFFVKSTQKCGKTNPQMTV